MNATLDAGRTASSSEQYWRGIFMRNPDFCSWQAPRQLRVRNAVRDCLSEPTGLVRLLDFGIGSLGLYRALDDDLMRRLRITGVSESQQHDPEDPLLARHAIDVAIGPGLSPLAQVPAGSQDRLVCSYVFDYLSDRTRSEALRAFARVLAGGAKLLLVLHHPRGKRADKFRRSRPYWRMARVLYEWLSNGRHAEASALLKELTIMLNAVFGDDDTYRGYLASYAKTAERFLSEFCVDGRLARPVPEAALIDCERTAGLIDRELAMTCEALRPIEHPASEISLPSELMSADLVECADPSDGSPIAHVLTAVRRRQPGGRR
jgi:hypothetical protein